MPSTSPTAHRKPRATKTPLQTASTLRIAERTLGGLVEVFKLLGDPSRLQIMLALAQDGELHVSALCELLDQSQPAVSHHLTLLRLTGLVSYRRDSKHHYYRIESDLICDLLEQLFAETGNSRKELQLEQGSLAYHRK